MVLIETCSSCLQIRLVYDVVAVKLRTGKIPRGVWIRLGRSLRFSHAGLMAYLESGGSAGLAEAGEIPEARNLSVSLRAERRNQFKVAPESNEKPLARTAATAPIAH